MQYLSPEERKGNTDVKQYLSGYISQSIKHDFPLNTLTKYWPDKNAAILDAGASSGAFLKQIHDNGYKNIYGLDLEKYIAADVPVKDFKTADFNTDTIPYADKSFDVITAWCVIAHLENPHHFLREAHRLLKPGGLLIASLPDIGSASEKINFYKKGEFIAYKPENDHIAIWTPSLLKKTTSKYFDQIGEEYLLKNKIFGGIMGRLRRWRLRRNPAIARKWSSKIAYILKNR